MSILRECALLLCRLKRHGVISIYSSDPKDDWRAKDEINKMLRRIADAERKEGEGRDGL
jgi:hypothetical protein